MLDTIINELNELKKLTDFMINNKSILESKDIEKYLRNFEKIRYEIFNKIKIYNMFETVGANRIEYINNLYKADIRNNVLKIFIPETLPKYKNINNYAYKNIMINTAEAVKDYKGMFKDRLSFCIIIVHEKQKNMDIDNKYVKPIIDALVNADIIHDDNINNMFYLVLGKNDTQKPYTEVFVMDSKYIIDWIKNLQKMF